MRISFLIYLAPLALAACGQPEPVVITPPAGLTHCASMPSAPELPELTADNQLERDRIVLDYVLALRTAYSDCAAKVAGLKAWVETVNE